MINIFQKAQIIFCIFICLLCTHITEAIEGLEGSNRLINSIINKCNDVTKNPEENAKKVLQVFLLGENTGIEEKALTAEEEYIRDVMRMAFEHHGAVRADAPGKHFEGTDPNCSFANNYATVMNDFIDSHEFGVIYANGYHMIVAKDPIKGYSAVAQNNDWRNWSEASYRPRGSMKLVPYEGYAIVIGFSFTPNPRAIENWKASCGSIHPLGAKRT
ncbi:MAG: hypothetical protein LBJ71_03170 [Holosporaceae bacterium]|jgi:hypothetical protein|nr:hypothetical protein [Holosporaceae bacterium]